MKIFMTGANGFVGSSLTRFLIDSGHEVTALVRSEKKAAGLPKGTNLTIGESGRSGPWQDGIDRHDVIINLAGASIFKRWNDSYKTLLHNSRILTTRNLVDALPSSTSATFISTSAVGYYGFTGDETLDEAAPKGNGFLADLAMDWETEARKAEKKGARVVLTRFGVVLGRKGGALAQMITPFRFFVGGPIGNGRQWVSWIHIRDLCRSSLFVIEDGSVKGAVNFTAPEALQNRDLAKALGKALRRPSFMPAPGFMINLVLGEFGSVILKGQRVYPEVLKQRGFTFEFPDINSALKDLIVR